MKSVRVSYNPMRVAVYTITKNEEQFIKRWAESCKDADYRLIVDTGSTDNTVQEAIDNGCMVSSVSISPWRFDDARNMALSLVPADADYCIALDADEVLTPGWRDAFEKVDSKVTRPRYKYVWSWTNDGKEGLTYSGDKIHSRHGYTWTHPVHEVITPIGEEVQGWVDLEIHHHPDHSKSRSQYLPLLELAVEERPDDDRNRFYLGRELMFHGRNEEAKVHLERHLELSKWAPERATCMRYLGNITKNREQWILRACAEAPYRREPWVDLARFYYEIQNWPGCYFASKQALNIKEKPLEYLCEEEAWGSLPHDLASVSAWNLDSKNESLFHAENALKLDFYNDRILKNIAYIYRDFRKTDVFAIIPTKSNLIGLERVITSLLGDPAVSGIAVICETSEAKSFVINKFKDYMQSRITVMSTDDGLGIQHMWNVGMDLKHNNDHCLFINDDVELEPLTISSIAGYIDSHNNVGLVCPNYDDRKTGTVFIDTNMTCRGRYDGTGGMAGFCMMLSADLAWQWAFDEKMIWWYGDDDLLNWVVSQNRKAGIFTPMSISGNSSWTINNDIPKDFDKIVENDRLIFEKKWGK